jgi:ABC-type transport system involved in multi-copper enzyme maturation permease subunit
MNALLATARADLTERMRRPAFLVVTALTALVTYAFVPPADAPYTIIDLGGFRGSYTSAWIGAMLTVLLTQFIGFLGFYYVRGAVAFDLSSGVGQILGATPLARRTYVLGKWLSNWAILALLTAIVGLMGILLLLGRGEDDAVHIPALITPLLIIALPAMGLVAALATLFDAVRPLRGAVGSMVYFVVFLSMLGGSTITAIDPSGIALFRSSITAACSAVYGAACAEQMAVGIIGLDAPMQTFAWSGMDWTLRIIAGQWLWLIVSLGIVLIGAQLFDGFRASRVRQQRAAAPAAEAAPAHVAPVAPVVTLTPVQRTPSTFIRVLAAELRLILKGRAWWWYLGAVGWIVACAASPAAVAVQWLLPLAWIWPLLIWSELGTCAQRHGMTTILGSAPRPLARQLPSAWLATALVTLALAGGALVSLARAGDFISMLGISGTAMLIPALALALGRWSGSPRLFEIVYLLLWYGALNGVPGLTAAPTDPATLAVYLGLAGICFGLALVRRRA